MLSVFEANLIFEGKAKEEHTIHEYDDWLLEEEVSQKSSVDWELNATSGCCWGTRTVDISKDCIWKIHGGV